MKKYELNNGDIVLTRNGDKHIFLKNVKYYGDMKDLLVDINDGQYLSLDDYNMDLKEKDGNRKFDVIKVYSPRYVGDSVRDHIIDEKDIWTWERDEEIKEMTLKEVCEKLGYEIKIIKEDN